MWQKCPICNGEGKLPNGSTSSALFRECDTCNGRKIISELNGLPPQGEHVSSNQEFLTQEELRARILGK